MVVAAPAQRMPRSARIHSMRVEERMAQRCSFSMPSERSPPAMALTRLEVSFQVSHCQPSPTGNWKALRSGDSPTR